MEFEALMWLSMVHLQPQLFTPHNLTSNFPLTAWWWLMSRLVERPRESLPFLCLGCTEPCDAGDGKEKNLHSKFYPVSAKTLLAPSGHLKGCELLMQRIQVFFPPIFCIASGDTWETWRREMVFPCCREDFLVQGAKQWWNNMGKLIFPQKDWGWATSTALRVGLAAILLVLLSMLFLITYHHAEAFLPFLCFFFFLWRQGKGRISWVVSLLNLCLVVKKKSTECPKNKTEHLRSVNILSISKAKGYFK